MPRRPPRGSNPGRGRTWLVVGGVVLFILITSLRGIASFYTDYLWFDSLGRSEVWQGVLGAKLALSIIFTGAFFLLMWVNLVIADRLAPAFRPAGPGGGVHRALPRARRRARSASSGSWRRPCSP